MMKTKHTIFMLWISSFTVEVGKMFMSSRKDVSCLLLIAFLYGESAAVPPFTPSPLPSKELNVFFWIDAGTIFDCTWSFLQRSDLDWVFSNSGSLSLSLSIFLNGWSVRGTPKPALENSTAFLRFSFLDSTYKKKN